MRILFAIPLLALAACQVSKDDANGTTTVTYNSDVAENAAADIGNDLEKTGDKISNKVDNTDVDVNVNTHDHTNTTTENKH